MFTGLKKYMDWGKKKKICVPFHHPCTERKNLVKIYTVVQEQVNRKRKSKTMYAQKTLASTPKKSYRNVKEISGKNSWRKIIDDLFAWRPKCFG